MSLSHSVPLVVRLVQEYREGFESRYAGYPIPLCNCCLNELVDFWKRSWAINKSTAKSGFTSKNLYYLGLSNTIDFPGKIKVITNLQLLKRIEK
ncbi:hypothetical protein BpHYR1_043080 [Brachionus plicatilis]|uniref:Uncharacterized protein n=1 Tax=Brachionus plicatilis TaxID=10195 RepID=A0A3M7PM41_BRAPC|nr:hypothetical protein BpHYR1_043080 [Brachionus plicatilis]